MPKPSKLFYEKTHKEFVYNIQAISNMASVIQYGILSYHSAFGLNHVSIAMKNVQKIRDNIIIPNGKSLHSYASTYFNPRNPMMYKRHNDAEDLCILAVFSNVLDIDGTVVSDGNGASSFSRFYSPVEGIEKLDFDTIYSKSWLKDELTEQQKCKRVACAEVLVPDKIPFKYVRGAIAVNEKAKHALELTGFKDQIIIDPYRFFRKGG